RGRRGRSDDRVNAREKACPMLTVPTAENTLSDPNNATHRVMNTVSLLPEQDLHFVLCDFGPSGQAYVETDPTEADASTILRYLLRGQYDRPIRVIALNVEEGWVRDVSSIIASKVDEVARRNEQVLSAGTREFVEAHSESINEQQLLPLWQ